MSYPDLKILEKLYQTFADNMPEDPEEGSTYAKLLDKEESGFRVPVLTTLHYSFGSLTNIAEGLFYFDRDLNEGADTFISRIVVVPEVEAQKLLQASVLLSLINSRLPVGCFGVDMEENALIYSLCTPVAEGLSEDELYELCDRCMAIALSVCVENAHDLVLQCS